MIEVRLSLAEARWLLGNLGLVPSPDSPLRDPMEGAGEAPAGSTAEANILQGLSERGAVTKDRAVNPFLSAALTWLARPEKVWSLSLMGRGGAEVVHLAFREDAAVECKRDPTGVRLRFPLAGSEGGRWLALHVDGGGHD